MTATRGTMFLIGRAQQDEEIAAQVVQIAVLSRAGEERLKVMAVEELNRLLQQFPAWRSHYAQTVTEAEIIAAGIEIGGAL